MTAPGDEYTELLNQVPRFQDRESVIELSGGLTNRNLKVTTPSRDYVVRISSNKSEFLSIDRKSEYENSKIAAAVGIGAPVYDFLPESGLLIIGFLPGKTYQANDVANNLDRIATSVRQLHNAKPFVNDFDMFQLQQNYLKITTNHGFKMPHNYHDFYSKMVDMNRALAVLDEGKVACNNDLLPANFIDDGEKVWLIDYEYSGNNDACFELGNIYSESNLSQDQLVALVTSYYGVHRPEKVARAWLFALLARYGWTLWASIQNSVSEIDFNFWEWGMQKFETAQRDFTSMKFKEALDLVSRKT